MLEITSNWIDLVKGEEKVCWISHGMFGRELGGAAAVVLGCIAVVRRVAGWMMEKLEFYKGIHACFMKAKKKEEGEKVEE